MNKKIVIYLVIILIILAVAFYFFSMSKNNGTKINQTPNYGTQTNQEQMPVINTPNTTIPSPTSTTSTTTVTSTTVSGTTSAKTHNVSVINFSFNPGILNINKGDTVVWTNQDSVSHQIWGNNFQGPVISNSQSYSFVFGNTGTFNYHCNIHPSMQGTIVVK